jgi:CelD/BcsL family acetyltransferase involved in cellulose biosynthesis
MQRTVTVETVTSVDGVAALRPCYERLQRAAGNILPFALYEWHLAWCHHFLNRSPRIRDEPLFYVLRDAEGECVAILPFIVSRRRVGPLKIVSIDLLGADPLITEIRAPVIVPGYESLTARAVQHQLANFLDCNWDWIHWSGISAAFAEALAADGSLRWLPSLPDFVLDLAPSWEEFRRGLKRNIRESLRHCYNSLKRDGLQFELQVVDSVPEVRRNVDRFIELHAMRAGVTGTTPHPNRFASPISRDFLYEVCERLAGSGALHLFRLNMGSQIVAMRIGIAAGDSLYLYYSGYDPAWARYGVMTTTVAEALKYAIAHGFKTVNLSPTREVSKTRWGPREVVFRSAFQQGARLRSRLAARAYVTARSGAGLQSRLLQLIPARRNWH